MYTNCLQISQNCLQISQNFLQISQNCIQISQNCIQIRQHCIQNCQNCIQSCQNCIQSCQNCIQIVKIVELHYITVFVVAMRNACKNMPSIGLKFCICQLEIDSGWVVILLKQDGWQFTLGNGEKTPWSC